ncbi:MAG: hypothetical protein K9J48_02905 [Desulfohalobiaceae bacterium]|nr:hypothetical protein [Desulfohalobiaceae bacterium]MCF8085822.1 hypothetical protein [Desulfohalobiaceae bacterium]
MSQRISYTKIENELWPEYRDRLNKAESTEDVKKFFAYTAMELLAQILESREIKPRFEDVQLDPEGERNYILSARLSDRQEVADLLAGSDLSDILQRLARAAVKRYQHLSRNPDRSRFGTFYDKSRSGSFSR